MNKIEKLLGEKSGIGCFSFSTYSKYKVRIKEIIEKNNKEIIWKFEESKGRNKDGDSIEIFRLSNPKESLLGFKEKMGLFIGMIEEIHKTLVGYINEEEVYNYNKSWIGVGYGKDFKLECEEIRLDKDKLYYYTELYDRCLYFMLDINLVLKVEKEYPEIIKDIFGETVQELYERDVTLLKKRFINRDELKSVESAVQKMEHSSNVIKVPHKKKKFRFHLE